MVELDTVLELIKLRMKRVLEFGELALAPAQYAAFRRLVLNEFGRSGLEAELEQVFRGGRKERAGMGGPTMQGKEVSHG